MNQGVTSLFVVALAIGCMLACIFLWPQYDDTISTLIRVDIGFLIGYYLSIFISTVD